MAYFSTSLPMANRVLSLFHPPLPHLPPPRNRLLTRCSSSILWFKHDLRVDDHPGLVRASSFHSSLLPLYVFDQRILSRYSEDTLELLLFALQVLRDSLERQGSNLMFRFGPSEDVILRLVREVKATSVFAEEDVEYHLCTLMDSVEETLLKDGSAKFVIWRTPFYAFKDFKNVPSLYEEFEKLGFHVTSPLAVPTLPSIDVELDWGSLPTLGGLKNFVTGGPSILKDSWFLLKEMSAETILQGKILKCGGSNIKSVNYKNNQNRKLQNSAFVTQKQNIVGGGTDSVLNALVAYLRYLEGTARDDWQEVHEKLRQSETRDGASFSALFGPALCLGIISKRRVYFEAIKYEKERNAGFLSPFGYSTATVAAAVDSVRSMEWYGLLALQSQTSNRGADSTRTWRWNGFLVQYTVVGHEGPAVLLVHGFGAFMEHFRGNIHGISDGGNQVWALTVLGFGKSEKPNIVYTELMWAELLRDFIADVVHEPVHLVGNSVGGYLVSIVACCWPALVKSVVLINSAGDVVPGYGYLQIAKDRHASGAAWLGARLILFYLKSNIRSIVKNCYPTKPERVDDWLLDEMVRASSDPGGLVVLESVFCLNLSLPLNFLLEELKRKVLVIQGMKDPIADSKSKVAMFKAHCSEFEIKELDAGHCPHDELPEQVNSIIRGWILSMESRLLAGTR